MKILKKLRLKELKAEVLPLHYCEQNKLFGGYNNDCFWRCIAYMESGGTIYTESSAETYADSYFGSGAITDAGVDYYDVANYYAGLGSRYAPDFEDGRYIVIFNTADNVGNYTITGTWHAIVITGSTANGELTYFEPQDPANSGTFSACDAAKLTYAGY